MDTITLGAVAYDPKVVTIWDGFRSWFRDQGVRVDHVLYPHYERQVEDLLAGRIDIAWHSPLAWVRTRRLAEARDRQARPLVMRDTDQDLTSAVLVRADDPAVTAADLSGRVVATAAIDSPQARLLPLGLLHDRGLDLAGVEIVRHDHAVGTHGDDLRGEQAAVKALLAGEADAACVLTASQLLFAREGLLPTGAVRTLVETEPFDHCVMTALDEVADSGPVDHLVELLLGMDHADPTVRHLLDLEGLRAWQPGRASHFDQLDRAVDLLGLYTPSGDVSDPRYDP